MALRDALLPEFDHEMSNTRRTLERVPEDRLGWKPHEKSPTMAWLATHLARLPSWAVVALDRDSLDLRPDDPSFGRVSPANSRREILVLFDGNVSGARAAIVGASDERMVQPWTLTSAGAPVLTLPRIAVLRSFVMNHMIHHRAQLGVYLRLTDVAVPAIYGPTADEGTM